MKVFGLTGGIGSGKSYVAEVLRVLGVPVFDSDQNAKKLYLEDNSLRSKLIKIYSEEIYFKDGSLNKKLLADIIFSNETERLRVNNMVHPRLRKKFLSWVDDCKLKGFPIVAIESAIMFEGGLNEIVDFVVAVWAPNYVRIRRVMKRDHISKNDVIKRLKKQMPQKEVLNLSKYVVSNKDDDLIIPQLMKFLII